MNRIHFAIFPAILLGILVMILFTSLANTSETVQASNTASETIQPPTEAVILPTRTALPQPTAEPSPKKCSISIRYPNSIRQWCSLIEKYSQPAGLDANFIAAVMLQESGGNPKAYSSSGAVGLMQVMPRDGLAASFRCNSGPCFASRPTMTELYDPDFNISYGVRMLAGLIQKTGNPRDALRSYGPTDVGYYYADKVLKIFENYH